MKIRDRVLYRPNESLGMGTILVERFRDEFEYLVRWDDEPKDSSERQDWFVSGQLKIVEPVVTALCGTCIRFYISSKSGVNYLNLEVYARTDTGFISTLRINAITASEIDAIRDQLGSLKTELT